MDSNSTMARSGRPGRILEREILPGGQCFGCFAWSYTLCGKKSNARLECVWTCDGGNGLASQSGVWKHMNEHKGSGHKA